MKSVHSAVATTASPSTSTSTSTPASAPAPAESQKNPESPFVKPKFGGLLLVCGDCQRRSSGPNKHSAKDWRGELKKAMGHQPLRWRIVESKCLGLCPRKATAVAAAASGAPLRLAALRRKGELQTLVEGLASIG